MNRILMCVLAIVVSSCVKEPSQKAQVSIPTCPDNYDCDCSRVATNGNENLGLWGGKPSLKAMLTDEGWREFEKTVKAAHLTQTCEVRVLKEAAELPEGKPVLLNILVFAAEARIDRYERK